MGVIFFGGIRRTNEIEFHKLDWTQAAVEWAERWMAKKRERISRKCDIHNPIPFLVTMFV